MNGKIILNSRIWGSLVNKKALGSEMSEKRCDETNECYNGLYFNAISHNTDDFTCKNKYIQDSF